MPPVIWKKYTKEEIVKILNESKNIVDLHQKLGYHTRNGQTGKQIDAMLKFHNLELPNYKISEERVCAICGKSFIINDYTQNCRKYCYECSPATNNPTTKTKAMKKRIIEMKGGKCKRCGYNKCIDALELHHLDPSTKDYQLSNTGGAP